MAVVQISRIQVRRGKINSGTGLPQLASGEMAWAIDTQELYIGNGAVSEGAPAVGNTKILTINDLTSQGNILNIVTYIYKPTDITIITGPDANNPTTRILQDRLDDKVSVYAFGAVGDGITDDTVSIQRAIDQLFLNNSTKASDDTPEGVMSRKVLELPAGIFKTTDTIYIPSYANIQGAGLDKSIILFDPDTSVPNSPAFKFVNDTSTAGSPADIDSTDLPNQPRSILMSGFTVKAVSGENTCLYLDCVIDSYFDSIKLVGGWTSAVIQTSAGIVMTAKSSLVTCQHNLFKNIKFESFVYAVYAKGDIKANQFKDCTVSSSYQGFMLGLGANGYDIGEQYGPRETQIVGTQFINVKRQAVYVNLGSKNTTKGNTYTNVGCNGGGNAQAAFPQVYFNTIGNTSIDDVSDRPGDLAVGNPLPSHVYVPEVAGHGVYKPNFFNQVGLGYQIIPVPAFRLPMATDENSAPYGSIVYTIEYFYKSTTHPFSRKGTLVISADIDNGKIQLSDDYIVSADPTIVSETNQLRLDFSAKLVDSSNVAYTNPLTQSVAGIVVYYFNDYSADGGTLNYTYTASF